MTRDDWRRKHIAMHAPAPARVPTCHPERTHAARGLCSTCYKRWYKAQLRLESVAS